MELANDAGGSDGTRLIPELLMDQIEFANVLVLNKRDLLDPETAAGIEACVKKLNPSAKTYWTEFCKLDCNSILGANLFDFDEAIMGAGWLQELQNKHVPESEEFGISSFVYRAKRPFHPQKLYDLIQKFTNVDLSVEKKESVNKKDEEDATETAKTSIEGVIRSKGQLWVANCCAYRLDWHSAGSQLQIMKGSPWSKALLEAGYDIDEEQKKPGDYWDPVWGDREQELVVIGANVDKKVLIQQLDDALIDSTVFAQATQDKKRFEVYLDGVKKAEGEEGLEKLTEEIVMANTGGLRTAFDIFQPLPDPFFDGEAADRYMELGGDDHEDDEDEGDNDEGDKDEINGK